MSKGFKRYRLEMTFWKAISSHWEEKRIGKENSWELLHKYRQKDNSWTRVVMTVVEQRRHRQAWGLLSTKNGQDLLKRICRVMGVSTVTYVMENERWWFDLINWENWKRTRFGEGRLQTSVWAYWVPDAFEVGQ